MKETRKSPWMPLLITGGLILLSRIVPVPDGLSRDSIYLLGILASTILLWMMVDVTWPSVFCILSLSLMSHTSLSSMITSSMGNPTITFLIFSFCCSTALEDTQFVRRCAISFLSIPFAKGKPWLLVLLYFLSVLLLGSIMSTTVIVIIYLSINEELFAVFELKKGDKLGKLFTTGLIIVSAFSGAVTPIAHVFPLMAMNLYTTATGQEISYVSYILMALPTALMSLAVLMLLFRILLQPDMSRMVNLDLSLLRQSLMPVDRKEVITVSVFLSVCALWILPDLLTGLLPSVSALLKGFGTPMPPMLGSILLCILQADGKPVMDLRKTLPRIPWTSIFMAASALALGGQLSSKELGLTAYVSQAMVPLTSSIPPILFLALMVAFTGFLTNIASNMVVLTLACSIVLSASGLLGSSVHMGAMCAIIGMMSAYAFATPPAMTTVVLGTGSGWTTNGDMAKYGFLTLIAACLFAIFISYPIASFLM